VPAVNDPLDLLVRKLAIHVPLDEADREAIRALPHTLRSVDPHTYLTREGDVPGPCAILVSGFAFRQKLTGDGARQIVSIHVPGEPLDFQHLYLDVADHSVQTLTRAELALVARRDLQALARARPAVGHAMLVSILVDASIFREWVLNVGRRDARGRVAHLLCEFALRLQAYGLTDEYAYELPMSQEQLADAIGLTSVHVNRTLKALEDEGLITRQRRFVSFPDWERLRTAADFSERYLHLSRQKEGVPETTGQ
jgi:CRP-like cAMP-binding protein